MSQKIILSFGSWICDLEDYIDEKDEFCVSKDYAVPGEANLFLGRLCCASGGELVPSEVNLCLERLSCDFTIIFRYISI